MAILPMKKISIYGLNQNRKTLLELLQRQASVEILDCKLDKERMFDKADISSSKMIFESSQKSLQAAVTILDSLVKPESSPLAMFEGRVPITPAEYQQTEQQATQTLAVAKQIVRLNKKAVDLKAQVVRDQASIVALTPWQALDISMRVKKTAYTRVFLGTFPIDYDEQSLTLAVQTALPTVDAIDVEIISQSAQQTCAVIICHNQYGQEMEQALRTLGFSLPTAPSKRAPAIKIEQLQEQIEQANQQIQGYQDEIIALQEHRTALLYTSDYYTARIEKYQVLAKMAKSKSTFVLRGYIPAEDCAQLQDLLEEQCPCYVELTDPDPDEQAPVKLKNSAFSAPVEGVVESFSLPGKGEIDPSTIMAAFYYFLFGLMLSDMAYGLIMIIGCGVVLIKFKNMEPGLKNSIKMFLYCGISTAFWGLMFGSFFGDVIEVVSETFFGVTVSTPYLWYKPLNDPMRLLMFSMLLGIIHLFTGLGIKFYLLVKAGKVKDAIYDVLFWYFLVGGAIVYFMSTQMFVDISGMGLQFPAAVGSVGGALAIIGAVGIVLTGGRESKNPVIRTMKGAFSLYGATSYLSDILSYSRLLALGLATGVIASVFNQMGAMGGSGVVGVLLFIVVFILGHALNIGLNLLGAYVHSNRLEFVEFFGKFYEGGGRKFTPFSASTKHFKLTK